MLPTGACVTLGEAATICVECTDCGRSRWWRPFELYRFDGVKASTPLEALSARLSCSGCKDDGLPGKNISVQVGFVTDRSRMRAEAHQVNSQATPGRGSRAIGA